MPRPQRMVEDPATELVLTAPRSELGEAVAREQAIAWSGVHGHPLINLSLMTANTLLHDGHDWGRDAAAEIISSTRRALAEAESSGADRMVHASYAFLDSAEAGGTVGHRLRPLVDAALIAESMVLESGRAAAVVRVGYLYGPGSVGLRAYRRAFMRRRPYWAGPPQALQHHLHVDDAARALLYAGVVPPVEAGVPPSATPVLYATDNQPLSFADFMDHFARLVGRAHPRHIPLWAGPLVSPVVRPSHREMTALGARGQVQPRVPGFTPRYPDHQAGLAQVIEAWSAAA